MGNGRMTVAREGISTNKAASTRRDDVAFTPGAQVEVSSPSHQPGAETTSAHPRKIVLLHWLTVLCLCFAAGLILLRDEVAQRTLRQWLLEGHRHFGLLVLTLFFVRVIVRIRTGKLPNASSTSRIIRALATLTHVALYALLLTLPLLGWALSNAQDRPVHFFGATLPALVHADEDLADTLQVWHVDAAWILLGLVLLHISAALWHHFVLRDGVLRTMMPGRRRR